jgi:hypothetical protein
VAQVSKLPNKYVIELGNVVSAIEEDPARELANR